MSTRSIEQFSAGVCSPVDRDRVVFEMVVAIDMKRKDTVVHWRKGGGREREEGFSVSRCEFFFLGEDVLRKEGKVHKKKAKARKSMRVKREHEMKNAR